MDWYDLIPCRSEHRILETIHSADGSVRAAHILRECKGVTRGGIYVTLDRLQDRGLIKAKRYTPIGKNHEVVVYELTDNGRKVLRVLAYLNGIAASQSTNGEVIPPAR